MSSVVEYDKKGRILLPAVVRHKLRAKRFKIVALKDHLELHPLPDVQSLKGKYRKIIKQEWEDLEERSEEFVTKGRR